MDLVLVVTEFTLTVNEEIKEKKRFSSKHKTSLIENNMLIMLFYAKFKGKN